LHISVHVCANTLYEGEWLLVSGESSHVFMSVVNAAKFNLCLCWRKGEEALRRMC